MIQAIKNRLHREESGFTLIELMVVVLIIAILIAIAIPTFLGARTRAQDRATQSSLRNSLTAAKVIFTDNESYVGATAVPLQAAEPSLTFNAVADGVSTGPTVVSVHPVDATEWVAAARSNSNTCFVIRDRSGSGGPGTTYASFATDGVGAGCIANAAAALAANDTSW